MSFHLGFLLFIMHQCAWLYAHIATVLNTVYSLREMDLPFCWKCLLLIFEKWKWDV